MHFIATFDVSGGGGRRVQEGLFISMAQISMYNSAGATRDQLQTRGIQWPQLTRTFKLSAYHMVKSLQW